MITRLISAVVARLKEQMPEWSVDEFPDAPDRYNWAGARATLLVAWESSSYSDLESLEPFSARRELRLSVTLLARSLRGSHSIATGLDDVLVALFGWEPADTAGKLGCECLRPSEEKFVGEDQGLWRFVATYRSATVAVANTMPLSGPPFKQAIFKDPS